MPNLRQLAAALLLCISTITLIGCEKPILDKPVAQLVQLDLEQAVEKLGYKHSGSTSNTGKQVSNIMVSGTKPGADKKNISLTVAVFTVVAEVKEREVERLKKDGAVHVEGDRLLLVKVHPVGAEDPAVILKKLVGG